MRLHRIIAAATLATMVGAGGALAAPITIDITPSSAPNVFGSPSWAGYLGNALNSLEHGLGDIGDRDTDPTAYQTLGATYMPGDVMVTSFNSWRGTAGAAAPFNAELGNRIHFGLHITGDGLVRFQLEDLEFEIASTDGNVLGFAGDFIGFTFNCSTRFGVDWGADRAKGGGDDSTICGAGSGTALIDELVYVGVGNAYWPGGPGDPLTGQAALDATAANIYGNQPVITGAYWITGTDGTVYGADVELVLEVPEPASAGLLGAALAGLGLLGLRRRRKAA